jgi:hypothetical protein
MAIVARCLVCATIALCACNPPPERQTASRTDSTATVAPRSLPEAPASAPVAPPLPPAAAQAIAVPPGALYVCVKDSDPSQRTAIELAPAVRELCGKHPEMAPCRYERDACRRNGGRVFAADGAEITQLTEAEYDKRVMRARLRAD